MIIWLYYGSEGAVVLMEIIGSCDGRCLYHRIPLRVSNGPFAAEQSRGTKSPNW